MKMKKTIAILLVAIVALGCVFAADEDVLKLKKNVSGENQLYWTEAAVSIGDDGTPVNATDITEKEYTSEVTYYASLITNASSKPTLTVYATAFVSGTNYVGAEYTVNSNTTTVSDGNAVTIGSTTDAVGAGKRVVSVPVTIAAVENGFEKATAGDYVATLTAIVDGQ